MFVGPPERVNPVSDESSTYADQPHTAIVVVVDVLVDVVVVLVVDVEVDVLAAIVDGGQI